MIIFANKCEKQIASVVKFVVGKIFFSKPWCFCNKSIVLLATLSLKG
jgi:hypothetical protein